MTVADVIRRNGTDPAIARRDFLLFGDARITLEADRRRVQRALRLPRDRRLRRDRGRLRLHDFLVSLPDFSPKWLPTYLRIAREISMTATNKVLVRELRRQKFRLDEVADPIWWRERGERGYKPFTRADYERVGREFAAAGREPLLEI